MSTNPKPRAQAGPTPKGVVVLLEQRIGRFRRLFVVVGVVILAAVIGTAVAGMWEPLLAALLVVPLVGLFLVADAVAVLRWQASALIEWAGGRLSLDNLRDTLASVPQIPPKTVRALFDPLPTSARLGTDQLPPPAVREGLAFTAIALAGRQIRATFLSVVVLTLCTAAVVVAVLLESWYPLIAVPVVTILGRVAQSLGSGPPPGWAERLRRLRAGGMDFRAFADLARKLDWSKLPGLAALKWWQAAAS